MIETIADLVRRTCNTVFYHSIGKDSRPVFFDVKETYPELLEIDAQYDTIREELMGVLPMRAHISRYHDVDESQTAISAGDEGDWRVLFVKMHNVDSLPNADVCRRTTEVVERIPGVLQAFFSILEPNKSVPAHNGPYMGYLRYHTGFVVPKENPPTIRVKDQPYTWKERESVLFDDSWNHEVTNEADSVRVVLIVDVLRPMPWPLHLLNLFARAVFFSRGMTAPALKKIEPIRPPSTDVLEPASSARSG